MDNFKVLSLDGGGVRGTFTASFLNELQKLVDDPLYHYFDLIVGTSTGGIIALAIALGIPIGEVLTLYETKAKIIFGKGKRLPLLSPKHNFKHSLEIELQKVFGNRKLGDAQTRVLIPTIDLTTGQVKVFKTPHHPDFYRDHEEFAWQVAMATASPPIFAPSFLNSKGYNLVDGGIWANNPALIGVIEAMCKLGVAPQNIRVLSIGTGFFPQSFTNNHSLKWGILQWILPSKGGLFKLFLYSQNQFVQNVLRYFELEYYQRIDFMMDKDYRLDDYKNVGKFKTLGIQKAQEFGKKIKEIFLNEKCQSYQLIYGKGGLK